MRPSAFSYHAPATIDEALRLMQELADPVVLAGGQTLIPLLNMRLVRPAHVVDLERVAELSFLDARDGLRVGAMVRQHEVATSPLVRAAAPLLAHATAHAGQPQTRSRGTIGGSVAFGSSVAEMSVALLALDAAVTLRSARGARTMPLAQFFVGHLTTALAPDELLVEIAIPPSLSRAAWGFSELKLRGCDFPIVICAVSLGLGDDGVVERARVAIGGAGPAPLRLAPLEAEMVGRRPSPDDAAAIAGRAAELIDPEDDAHAPADYRRAVAVVQLEHALRSALGRERHGDG